MNAPAHAAVDRLFDEAPGSLAHAAREAIVTIDESQRIVMINPAAQRMFGCTAAEALGSELTRFIPLRYRAAHPGTCAALRRARACRSGRWASACR